MSITLTIDHDGFDHTVQLLQAGVEDMREVSPAIAQLLEDSVRRNFREGGRPSRWPSSKRADHQAAYGNTSGQTLVDTARLMNSIVGEGMKDKVMVGTNVAYAAAHNFGVDEEINQQVREHVRRISQAFGKPITLTAVTVKAHRRKVHLQLPQREFMLVQDEDWQDIDELIVTWLNNILRGA